MFTEKNALFIQRWKDSACLQDIPSLGTARIGKSRQFGAVKTRRVLETHRV